MFRTAIAALSLFAVSCVTSTPSPSAEPVAPEVATDRAPADLVITGGIIVPIEGENIADGAVVIRDGAIVEVGPSSIAGRYAARETIDARGSAILPGFVNTHTHAPMVLFRGIADDRDLMDWLQSFIFPAEAKNVSRDFVKWGTRLAVLEMIRSGTTCYADMYYFEADIAEETRRAGLRGVLGETMIDFPVADNKTWDEAVAYVRAYTRQFANDPLITPALAPHAPYTVSADHLRQVRALANELGAPILIHLSETEDELRQVAERSGGKTPTAYLDSLGFLGTDVVAAHAVWSNADDIALLARHDVGVAYNPESNMMLASGVAPVPAMIAAGIDLGIGTDGPAGSNNNLDMIEEMGSAARLQKIMRKDPKALSAKRVLELATLGGARALNLDSKIGSLRAGKRADVIVVRLDQAHSQPMYSVESAVVYSANGRDVTHTIVEGKVLMRQRQVLTIDEQETLSKAREYRDRILASLK